MHTDDPRSADPTSTIRMFSHPGLNGPVALKQRAGDGWLWFTLRGENAVGTLDSGAEDPLSTLRVFRSDGMGDPSALFIDRGRRVWWVHARDATVGMLDPKAADAASSVKTLGPWPHFGTPRAWAMSPSGLLWLTTQDAPGLLTFDPSANDPESTVRWVTDQRLREPDGVWFGVDNSVWFVDTAPNAIGS